jgi:hypothetical protein
MNHLLTAIDPSVAQDVLALRAVHARACVKPDDAPGTAQGLQHCFPCIDKAAGREFRQVWSSASFRADHSRTHPTHGTGGQIVNQRLTALEKSGKLPHNVYRKSLLDTAGGERFAAARSRAAPAPRA